MSDLFALQLKQKLARSYYTEQPPKPNLPPLPDLLDVPGDKWEAALRQRDAMIAERRATAPQRQRQWENACAAQAAERRTEFVADLTAHCGSSALAEKCLAFALAEQARGEGEVDDEGQDNGMTDSAMYEFAVRLAEHFAPLFGRTP